MSDFKFKKGEEVLFSTAQGSFDGVIVDMETPFDVDGIPRYRVRRITDKQTFVISEDHITNGKYTPSSAPEDLKVGDRVEVIDDGYVDNSIVGLQGTVVHVAIGGHRIQVRLDDDKKDYVIVSKVLRKLPDKISFENDSIDAKVFEEPDNVKEFRAILNEMAETYKAKDDCYGNAYADGYNRFGSVQLVSRMYEKYCRIENLLVHKAENKVSDESVLDTLTDLAVQSVVLRMLLQKNDFEKVE